MLRNIPNKYTQHMLMHVLDGAGLRGLFDFVYLPVDFKNRCNLGYAFLNCVSPAAAAHAASLLHGAAWAEFASRKVCAVARARVQGRAALVDHFRGARFPADAPACLPLVLELGPPPPGDPDGARAVLAVAPLAPGPAPTPSPRAPQPPPLPAAVAADAATEAAAYLAAKGGGGGGGGERAGAGAAADTAPAAPRAGACSRSSEQ